MGFLDWFKPARMSRTTTPDAAMRHLMESRLFGSELPRRRLTTHAQLAQMSEQELLVRYEPGIEAIRMTPDHDRLQGYVRELGRARHAPAVPLLTQLWTECAVSPIRTAAGFSLRDIGTKEARAALRDAIEDSDHISVLLAVLASFDEDPGGAYDQFAPRFTPERLAQPGGAVVPGAVLGVFAPSSFTGGKEQVPHWQEPRARQWLLDDPRWIDLCAGLRRDEVLGGVARAALRYSDPGAVKHALDRARQREPPAQRRVRSTANGDLLSRYRRGDHAAVWAELKAPQWIDGAFREEALSVAQETMRRFQAAAGVLADRLGAAGWRPLAGAFRTAPAEGDASLMAEAERLTGEPLPPALRAFWEIVGGVDFIWNYEGDDDPPDLGVELDQKDLDALSIGSAENLGGAIERWEDDHASLLDPELAEPFFVDLAPDRLTKANISGGGPYGIELPFGGVDPKFGNEEWSAPLVDYLRSAVRWGGFPGLARHRDQSAVQRVLTHLTRDLEPF